MAVPMIDIEYLKQLLEIFDASSVHDLRIEQEGVEIKLSKSPRREEVMQSMHGMQFAPMPMQMPVAPHQAPVAAPAHEAPGTHAAAEATAAAPGQNYHEIRSPIVGTFYRSPNPDSPAFVEVGSKVSPGAVLCIVEAMKLMNEIECDAYGTIAKIMVDNGQPVEYNQLLFLVEPD
jgi:acetyl-CoA carboxylase biotin carboxyl carrier protein